MPHHLIRRARPGATSWSGAGAAVTLAAGLAGAPQALAQDGGQIIVDYAAGVLASDNYELITNPSGTSTILFNDVAVAYENRTSVENFRLGTGFRLETGDYADTPDDGGGLTSPFAELVYGRVGRDSALSFAARYRETDVGLSDDVIDGQDLIFDSGTRQETSVNLGLDLGRSAPISFTGGLTYIDRRYVDTTNPDLDDGTFARARAGLSFRLNPNTSLDVSTEYFERDEDDDVNTFETNVLYAFGLTHQTRGGLTASVSGGFQTSEVTQDVNGSRETRVEEEPVVRFNLSQQRPNGAISAGFVQRVTDTGLQADLFVGRSLSSPRGAFDASIGVGYAENADTYSGIGSVRWTRSLPQGRFEISFDQRLETDDIDDDVLRSTAGVLFTQDLTRLSSLTLDIDVSAQEAVDADGTDAQRLRASLVYSYRLTDDWSLNTGYRHQTSRESDESSPTIRNEVFANIGRSFNIRP
jgi:hypothetical protein